MDPARTVMAQALAGAGASVTISSRSERNVASAVEVHGAFYCCQIAARRMVSLGDGGSIVVVSRSGGARAARCASHRSRVTWAWACSRDFVFGMGDVGCDRFVTGARDHPIVDTFASGENEDPVDHIVGCVDW